MRLPTPAELLRVWEVGLTQTPLERCLHLLRVSTDAPDFNHPARLSIGERDARLLQLREWLFGTRLLNKALCPSCAETAEWEDDTRRLMLQPPEPDNTPIPPLAREFLLEEAGVSVRFRLPNSLNLHRALTNPIYRANPNQLLADCILRWESPTAGLPVDKWPDTLVDALNRRMADEDPQADIQMAVGCPACGHGWSVRFDIMEYLWAEIDNWARHLLQDVAVLARAFGWAEADILSMTPQRRQLYIDLIHG